MLFSDASAGIDVSGDSGSGKSICLLNIILALLRLIARGAGHGLAVLDPHGDLVNAVLRFLPSLPRRVRERVIVIRPWDTSRGIAGLNPLFIAPDGLDEISWRARITTKVALVTSILLAAWGEEDLNSRPRLFRYTSLFLRILAIARMCVADVHHFFDSTSDVYQALSRVAPNWHDQLELMALSDMKPSEREELIASTKNRFLGLLDNKIVELTLGRAGAEGAFDVQRLIQEGYIVLLDLSLGGTLREEDQEILANLWLSEFLHAVFHTPEDRRVPFFLCIDELPVFKSSAPLLIAALRQVRKMKLRIICAHQGTQFFKDKVDDRLLNALVGQCGVHLYFRHVLPADARYFAEVVKLPSLDPLAVKHVMRTPQQFTEGHDLVTLTDIGENWSDGTQTGSSVANGTSQTDTNVHGTSDAERYLVGAGNHATQHTDATTRSQSDARGTTHTATTNESTTSQRGGSRSRRQTLVPRIKTRLIASSVQFFTTEEQTSMQAAEMADLPTGTCVLYVSGRGACRVRLPLPVEPLRRTPKYAARKVAEIVEGSARRPEFGTPAEITEQRARFTARLVEYLDGLSEPAPAGVGESSVQSIANSSVTKCALPSPDVSAMSTPADSPFAEGF